MNYQHAMNENGDYSRRKDPRDVQRVLGLGITRLRRRHGWSQAALAQRMGISRHSLGKWERGVRRPTLEHLVMLLDLLETTFEELLGVRGPEPRIPPAERSEAARCLNGFLRAIRPWLQPPPKEPRKTER